LLGLESVRGEKRFADDDIALLRMAGEIFANAIEREHREAERDALEVRLRQAQRMEAIGTLAGGIAHNFNNILSAILGYAEMTLARLPENSRPRRYVQEVRRAGERARGIIDQILTFSQRVDSKRQPVDLRQVVDEALGLLRASLPATIEFQTRMASADTVVMGDASQLQQVVVNLCTNAAQAMDVRGVVEIGLDAVVSPNEQGLSHGTLPAGRYVRLAVRDRGHGMDRATMERIFEPFFTTKAAGTGTGLGLTTVHGIVADHGGVLNVRSHPGVGTTFEAWFACAEAVGSPLVPPDSPLPRGQGQTILLVDDEMPVVTLGEEMLAELGYEPVGFSTARDALDALAADPQRFDVMLTDEAMPDMSGAEIAAAVHRLRPDMPILLMTGQPEPIEPKRLRAAGFREYLRKPLSLDDIGRAVARHAPRQQDSGFQM
jgi:signal transduction histidine kinase/CheY-like chemotaxis protein